MSKAVMRTTELVSQVARTVPLGTNLGLLHLLWAMLLGWFLLSRGVVVPVLALMGLERDTVRRAWPASSSARQVAPASQPSESSFWMMAGPSPSSRISGCATPTHLQGLCSSPCGPVWRQHTKRVIPLTLSPGRSSIWGADQQVGL